MKRYKFFKESLDYLKESRKFIYLATILFFVSSILFFINSFFGLFFVEQIDNFLNEIIRDILLQVDGLDSIQLIIFIFRNNFMSALSAIILGIFLGVFPVINALSNGAVLGHVAAKVVPVAGVFSLWRLLPHGIFELPAIFISIGIGMKLGAVFFVGKKKIKKELLYRTDRTLKVIVSIVLPLLIIAAIIEGILIGMAV